MIHIAICEDNEKDSIKLERCIEFYFTNYPAQYHISKYKSENVFLYNMENKKYDIVFFDVHIGEADGIKLSEKLRNHDESVVIIFMSHCKDSVFRCFDSSPLTYMLKPISYEDVFHVMEKALKKIKDCYRPMFSFTYENVVYSIPLDEIICFESNLRVIYIKTFHEQYRFYGKLSEIEKQLKKHSFVRCHQSYLVNMQHILKIDSNSILTSTNETYQISRGKSQAVKEKMLEYVGSML